MPVQIPQRTNHVAGCCVVGWPALKLDREAGWAQSMQGPDGQSNFNFKGYFIYI